MLTWGSKFFFALSVGSLLGAMVYGLVTGGGIGVISAGYKGGVGDHLGYTVLAFAAAALFVLGVVMVMVRDGDAEIMAARAGSDIVPPVSPPNDASYWGPLTAFGVAAVIIGLALNQIFFVLGLATLFVVAFMWTVLAWSDRATGDAAVNRSIRNRVLGPVEIPMLGLLAIAIVAVGVSRVFLAVPNKTIATTAGSLFTLFVFGSAVLLSRVDLKRQFVSGIVAVGALAVLAGGIVGAAAGERDFEHHGEDHSEEGDHSESEG